MGLVNEVHLTSWDQFQAKANELVKDSKKRQADSPNDYVSLPLFRGHGHSDWSLETSLERFLRRESNRADLHDRIIRECLPVVQTMTDRFGDLKFGDDRSTPELLTTDEGQRRLEYMVFLRHLGFPSPLLDWTQSPYVASFFAYRHRGHDKVAIWAFREDLGQGKGGWSGAGRIEGLGPTIRAHRRHVLQQSEYSWCVSQIPDNPCFYVPHEQAISAGENEQDELTKFILPASERPSVLRRLDMMNINALSLFENHEGLMETLANRQFNDAP